MSQQQIFTCDECGKQKQVSNHWWIASLKHGGFSLRAWTFEYALEADVRHICGEGCAAKLMSKWMESISRRPDAS